MNLEGINAWTENEAVESFRRCCGSGRWAATMAGLRPFESEPALLAAAERTWRSLDRSDWLEAFAAHPRIGDLSALAARFAATAVWSAAEQSGVTAAPDAVLHELAEGNALYEARFGYLFIVCATGKSAAEMLDLLRQRLAHTPEEEIAVAAAEQGKITRIRLEKLAP
jgi:2-oxo-4-hydroxy-4-carboxy-5-ureidoimidazoline decarboxylase